MNCRLRLSRRDVEQYVGALSDTLKANLSIAKNPSCHQELNQVMTSLGLADIPLDSWVGDKGRRLSGGELKRLGLARAILSGKAIWLLDEPFEGLDADNINRVVALLNSYSQKSDSQKSDSQNSDAQKHSIIIASHIVPECLEVVQTIDMDQIVTESFVKETVETDPIGKDTVETDTLNESPQDCLVSGESRAA